MSTDQPNGDRPGSAGPDSDRPSTPEEIKADIEQQREHLAETVDALHEKLDVKKQARAKASELKDRATTDGGAPRPELIAAGVAVVVLVALWVYRRRR